jgi:hypothetical protein
VNRQEHNGSPGLMGEAGRLGPGTARPRKTRHPAAPRSRSAERTAAQAVISGSARNPTPRVTQVEDGTHAVSSAGDEGDCAHGPATRDHDLLPELP